MKKSRKISWISTGVAVGILSLLPMMIPPAYADPPQRLPMPSVWNSEDQFEMPVPAWKNDGAQLEKLAEDPIPFSLQLYPLEKYLFLPESPVHLLLMGRNAGQVVISLWKINLVLALQQGWTTSVSRLPEYGIQDASFGQTIATKPGMFKHKIELPPLPAGCYAVTAHNATAKNLAYVIKSDLGLLVKRDRQRLLIWANSLTHAASTPVRLYFFSKRRLVYETSTSPDGIWAGQVEGDFSPLTVLAVRDNHCAVAEAPWYFSEHQLYRCYVDLSQPFYFPGQDLDAKFFFRHWNSQAHQYSIPTIGKLSAIVQDSQFRPVHQAQLEITEYGTASFHYSLPSQAKPGIYTIRVLGAGLWTGSHNFNVLAIPQEPLPEIQFSPVPEPAIAGETVPEALQKLRAGPLGLATESLSYTVGQTASFSSHLTPARAVLFTFEADQLFGYARTSGNPVNKKLADYHAPALQVVASSFTPENLLSASAHLVVRDAIRQLQLTPTIVPTAIPHQLQLTIAVRDAENRPVQAEILVKAMPTALRFRPGSLCSLYQFYYQDFDYREVTSSNSFEYEFPHSGEYHAMPWEIYEPKPASKDLPAASSTSMPPGTGPYVATLPSPILYPLAKSFWNGAVLCNPEGVAQTSIMLPATIAEWRIIMMAIDRTSRIGEAELVVERK